MFKYEKFKYEKKDKFDTFYVNIFKAELSKIWKNNKSN